MSIIQTIRDKGARVAVVLIALALLGFIAMDAFTGRSNLFGGGPSTTVGRVNGRKIDYDNFQRTVAQQEKNYQDQGYPSNDAMRQQIIDQVWNTEVDKLLVQSEVNKLGMSVSDKELNNGILFGKNPPEDLKKQFTDPQTGEYNAQLASQQLKAFMKRASRQEKDAFIASLEQLKAYRLQEKYFSLFTNSNNTPKWMLEKQNADNSQLSRVTLVRKLYAEIPDSSVKVTDKDVEDYIREHKDDFKQEESRSISYVSFSALPSAADTVAIRTELEKMKPEFEATTDADSYVSQKSSRADKSIYAGKSLMMMQYKDSIQKLPIGAVMGPYMDQGSFALAKMIDIKQLPDSVKCRHILIGTVDPQTGQPLTEDSVAKVRADSIERAIAGGANFDTLETKYSTDQSAHLQKGVMTFASSMIQGENFAKEFGQFVLFDGKPGDKKVVKTSFGYHYIEIMNFINVEPHYKVAYLFLPIVASDETDDKAKNEAAKFAGDARDEKSFNDVFEKELKPKNYVKGLGYDITPNAFQVTGLEQSREFVRKIYEAKRGQVIGPERVGESYVVAVITEVNEEGTQSVNKARMRAEAPLRNRKKAEIMRKELGPISTVEAAAAKWGKQVETIDSIRMARGAAPQSIAFEPKIVGASFNAANQGKVIQELIEGSQGVFVVRVDNITTTPLGGANVDEQRKALYEQGKQQAMYNSPLQSLREAANIKDMRAKHF
jgi:peptidyl-prolyl cis-trans isomerase D